MCLHFALNSSPKLLQLANHVGTHVEGCCTQCGPSVGAQDAMVRGEACAAGYWLSGLGFGFLKDCCVLQESESVESGFHPSPDVS